MINTNADTGKSGVSLAKPENWNTEYEGKVSDLFAHFKIRVEDNGQAIVIDAPEAGTAPQMILTPEGWQWPIERENIEVVYPGFTNWSQNATLDKWNESKKDELVYPLQ